MIAEVLVDDLDEGLLHEEAAQVSQRYELAGDGCQLLAVIFGEGHEENSEL